MEELVNKGGKLLAIGGALAYAFNNFAGYVAHNWLTSDFAITAQNAVANISHASVGACVAGLMILGLQTFARKPRPR